ncbi:DUF262 domain-containing protein [Methylobacterium mesophilicum]|uniref:DUF262 domain-containing protein n=1 Tax=Methylobacterium mesophilicum TaxID=39956 RepID=UPI002F30E64C
MADISAEPKPIQAIYEWFSSSRIIVNRSYQRKLVWTLEEKQKLIDSILKRYPIPLILMAEVKSETDSNFEIIDGLQRLHTIISFIEGQFCTSDGRYFATEYFTAALNRRKEEKYVENADINVRIDSNEVALILNYVMPVSILRNITPEQITEVFSRINSYGHRLSDQERRQAGLLGNFSNLVRNLACDIRGDVSFDRLLLNDMPSISIDLPNSRYGYQIQASNVFWVRHGILQSTGLRDSMDEQAIADLIASVVLSDPVDRSKEYLDNAYDAGSEESIALSSALQLYGEKRLADEFKFVIQVIDEICAYSNPSSLRKILFKNANTNPFPTIFSTVFLAVHNIIFKDKKVLSDTAKAYDGLTNITERLNTRRNALSVDERKKNLAAAKGILQDAFVSGKPEKIAYTNISVIDLENLIRRSPIETSRFEIKQGVVNLDQSRKINISVFDDIVQSICGIANIGKDSEGHVLIGVADREEHAKRIEQLDAISAINLGKRFIVGVDREAKILGITTEQYLQKWRDAIANSKLSQLLKDGVLANIDLITYRGLNVVHIRIPSQKAVSLVGDSYFSRKADSTHEAKGLEIASLFSRF